MLIPLVHFHGFLVHLRCYLFPAGLKPCCDWKQKRSSSNRTNCVQSSICHLFWATERPLSESLKVQTQHRVQLCVVYEYWLHVEAVHGPFSSPSSSAHRTGTMGSRRKAPFSIHSRAQSSACVPRVFWPLMNAVSALYEGGSGEGRQRGSAHTPRAPQHTATSSRSLASEHISWS
jgi:hypothetical protein